MQYVDLAPAIYRQRCVVEGTMRHLIMPQEIVQYLTRLGEVAEMDVLTTPVTHQSPLYGWAGWVHWETSGAHFYAWDKPLFFSVDIYTCKAFNPQTVVEFTREFFNAEVITCRSF